MITWLAVSIGSLVLCLVVFAIWNEIQTRRFVSEARAIRSRRACAFHWSHGFEFKPSCTQCAADAESRAKSGDEL